MTTSISISSLTTAFVVALVSILIASLWHVAPYKQCIFDIEEPEQLFGTARAYDDTVLAAPVLAHPWILSLAARILVSSPLGDWLTRYLLEKNCVSGLIELAHAIHSADPALLPSPLEDNVGGILNVNILSGKEFGLGEPLVRLSNEAYQWHVQQAQSIDPLFPDSLSTIPPPHSSYRSVRDYHAAYQSKMTTPTIVVQRLLQFIKETNSTLRCIEDLDEDAALQAAEEATQRFQSNATTTTTMALSIWDGVPVMIKSETPVAGMHWSSGRPRAVAKFIPKGSTAAEDVLVQRLRKAGAIVIATTVMHEKGVQPTGFNSHYGGPMNPYDLDRFSGGSSSGSAVAVATGMTPMAIGFDGGGSVRIPAAWSGTVGLAVGYSRIPHAGTSVHLSSVTKAGPLTATIQDAADALVLLGQPLSVDEGREKHMFHVAYGGEGPPPPHFTPRWHDKDTPIKIGVFSSWVSHRSSGTGKGFDDKVFERYQEALQRLTKHTVNGKPKYQIVEFSIPHMKEQALAHGLLITSMFSFSMVKELYQEKTSRNGGPEIQFQPATQIQIKLGQQISALELMACMRIRAFAMAQWRAVLSHQADVILTPTVPMTALRRPHGSDVLGFSDTSLMVQIMRFIWPGNLAGLPGLAVPVGKDGLGLPVSVQVICTHWHEADCLSVGADIEHLFAQERPQPPSHLFFDPLVIPKR
jgi:Asp-tRNA(Asn)/Glu-tRNA(Gln) amidotransferase A subunit family amidase